MSRSGTRETISTPSPAPGPGAICAPAASLRAAPRDGFATAGLDPRTFAQAAPDWQPLRRRDRAAAARPAGYADVWLHLEAAVLGILVLLGYLSAGLHLLA